MEDILKVLPWIAQIDAFQHWVYTNPTHSLEERSAQWLVLSKRFGTGLTEWTGFEDLQAHSWQRQLHLYEVPFYYIEYGMAQLGAIAVWRNYKANPQKTVEQYKAALSLGYTVGIKDIYAAAGIKFDFSKEYVKELIDFVFEELKALKKV